MTKERALSNHIDKVTPRVHPLWRYACLTVVTLNFAALMWWYVGTSLAAKGIVREISSRCNMDAVFPSMLVPQSRNLIVNVDGENSNEDVRRLAEIVERLGRRRLIDRIWLQVDGGEWTVGDFESVIQRCHFYSIHVSVYLPGYEKPFWCVPSSGADSRTTAASSIRTKSRKRAG
ncbi:MAG TPA: hypothetical protein ENJ16_04435 [Planctomycetaceae bacterium]|nr:hypothetical protein [Planctomycetaceae bacterium]